MHVHAGLLHRAADEFRLGRIRRRMALLSEHGDKHCEIGRLKVIAHRLHAARWIRIPVDIERLHVVAGADHRNKMAPGGTAPNAKPLRIKTKFLCARSQRMAALQSSICAGNTA